jgi:hypothetical protein
VNGGNSSVSSELYGEVVRSTNRNRTIGPLGCNEHITPCTDPIYIFEIWMVLVHNRGIFPMTEPIMMSVRRKDVDVGMGTHTSIRSRDGALLVRQFPVVCSVVAP